MSIDRAKLIEFLREQRCIAEVEQVKGEAEREGSMASMLYRGIAIGIAGTIRNLKREFEIPDDVVPALNLSIDPDELYHPGGIAK